MTSEGNGTPGTCVAYCPASTPLLRFYCQWDCQTTPCFFLVPFALAVLQGLGDVGVAMRSVPSRPAMVRPAHRPIHRPPGAPAFVEMLED